MKQALAIGAHPDDIEVGCSGTLKLLQASGCEITYVAFSMCAEGQERIVKEFKSATKQWDKALNLGFPNRHLPDKIDSIREHLESYKNGEKEPDIVFCPTSADIHQDHAVVSLACRQVFRHYSVLGYETYKSGTDSIPNIFFELSDADIAFKKRVISIYRTQRRRFDPEAIISLARYRGQMIDCKWAEAFECIRFVNPLEGLGNL